MTQVAEKIDSTEFTSNQPLALAETNSLESDESGAYELGAFTSTLIFVGGLACGFGIFLALNNYFQLL